MSPIVLDGRYALTLEVREGGMSSVTKAGIPGIELPRVDEGLVGPGYRLAAYTPVESPAHRIDVLNQLHGHIQDVLNEYGVQIMPPHYMMERCRSDSASAIGSALDASPHRAGNQLSAATTGVRRRTAAATHSAKRNHSNHQPARMMQLTVRSEKANDDNN